MELTHVDTQTIQPGGVVIFDAIAVEPCCCMNYRLGSGLTTLKGMTAGREADYDVQFGGNVALATGAEATAAATLAIAIAGEPLPSTTMISTPGAVGEFNNVSTFTTLDVPRGCCYNISVENTSTVAIDLSNARLSIKRIGND